MKTTTTKTILTSSQIRTLFLAYFRGRGHTVVSSSALTPASDDQSLLFTNAGMVQFKDVFLGLEKRPYLRAVSSQRCMRAGGKHNDLENVGYTGRHHTFFEMLGNFSFGDYFKEQAIQYAWEFLTHSEYLNLPKEKLWITVYKDDDESRQIWIKKIGIPPARIISCDEKDNFWRMGDTGPCGPCSEIYYDHGETAAGGLPGTPEADGDRFVEIWNLVFMQYNRLADGSLIPLPKPSVDTGMGLERITAVMQNAHNNYQTDLFLPFIQAIRKIPRDTSAAPAQISESTLQRSFNVLSDHIRASCFLMIDGITPSNEGRGYVLRRIIRRAVRHGRQTGMTTPFFYRLVQPLINIMGEAYPDLKKSRTILEKNLIQEEEQFARTLEQGMKILNHEINLLKNNEIPGELAFKLYDTYGFPLDLTADIAREKNLVINQRDFEKAMKNQRQKARQFNKFRSNSLIAPAYSSEFTGYQIENLTKQTAEIIDIFKQENPEKYFILLNTTPFYAESGGQIGDAGKLTLISPDHSVNPQVVFKVVNTVKHKQAHLHEGYIEKGNITSLKKGSKVTAEVDRERRKKITLNHTATHLLHAALRKILGAQAVQKGSLVAAEKLRFDFSYPLPLSLEKIRDVELQVNHAIRNNYPAEKVNTTPEKAIENGALALFGEKYGETVRTLKLGDFSHELCGGTHVNYTGEIGLFKIISETGIAAGIRRIEAVTGEQALYWVMDNENILLTASHALKTDPQNIVLKLNQKLEQQKLDQQKLDQLNQQINHQIILNLLANKKLIHHIPVISENLGTADLKNLRNIADDLKVKIKTGIIILISIHNYRVNLIIGVTKDLVEKYPAQALIKPLAEIIGGKGGGRPDMAQAGGDKADNIEKVLSAVPSLIEKIENLSL